MQMFLSNDHIGHLELGCLDVDLNSFFSDKVFISVGR